MSDNEDIFTAEFNDSDSFDESDFDAPMDTTSDDGPELLVKRDPAPNSQESPKEDTVTETESPKPEKPISVKPRKKANWHAIVLAIVIVFLLLIFTVVIAAFISKPFQKYLKQTFRNAGYDESTVYSFTPYANNSFGLINNNLVVGNSGNVIIFQADGSILKKEQQSYSTPLLQIADSELLLCDIGGHSLKVLDSDGNTLSTQRCTGSYIDADLASNGYSCCLYHAEGSKAVLEVYHNDGSVLLRHTSKTTFFNACAISDDGTHVAVTALGQSDITYQSYVYVYETDNDNEPIELNLGDQIIYDLKAVSSTAFCAVGESSLLFFDREGQILGEYDLDRSSILYYSFADNYTAVILDTYQVDARYQLFLLQNDGSVRASIILKSLPTDLSTAGSYIGVLTADNYTVYSSGLGVTAQIETNGEYTNAIVRSDGTSILVANGEGIVYIP